MHKRQQGAGKADELPKLLVFTQGVLGMDQQESSGGGAEVGAGEGRNATSNPERGKMGQKSKVFPHGKNGADTVVGGCRLTEQGVPPFPWRD